MGKEPALDHAKAEPFFGRILDADGHMYMPPAKMLEIGGKRERMRMVDFLTRFETSEQYKKDRENNRPELWAVKGLGALGAFDPKERVEALDRMGMKVQLVFSNGGMGAQQDHPDDHRAAAKYADYMLDFQKATGGRARMVVPIPMYNVEQASKELDRVIAKGAKAIGLECTKPPANVSPANELWDPFWRRLEETDTVATLHLGCGGLINSEWEMFPARGWGDATTLKNKPAERSGGEEAISPWFMMIAHMGAEVYLQAMVMGGVFERFPKLRLGIIECGAKWVGPCVERMDLWTDFMAKVGRAYPMKPSEYVKRNVRVTPFWHENLPLMIQRYGLEDIYIFSTDYPHLEGSRDPIGKFRKWLKDLPADYAQRFFIDNAKLIFPGVSA